MNPLNYASLEASRRLVEAGIKIPTEVYWHIPEKGEPELLSGFFLGALECSEKCEIHPAPSMAEIWRELPVEAIIYKGAARSYAYLLPSQSEHDIDNANPADALIDLLIWVSNEALRGEEIGDE